MPKTKKRGAAAFVRAYDDANGQLPARQVAEAAVKAGYRVNPRYVYAIRAQRPDTARIVARKVARLARPQRTPDQEFAKLCVQLGFRKSEELLNDVDKKIASVLASSHA